MRKRPPRLGDGSGGCEHGGRIQVAAGSVKSSRRLEEMEGGSVRSQKAIIAHEAAATPSTKIRYFADAAADQTPVVERDDGARQRGMHKVKMHRLGRVGVSFELLFGAGRFDCVIAGRADLRI
jgi:hypothetical protein